MCVGASSSDRPDTRHSSWVYTDERSYSQRRTDGEAPGLCEFGNISFLSVDQKQRLTQRSKRQKTHLCAGRMRHMPTMTKT